ncbi:MAG: hypothetical protein JRM90_07695, partial [Nitrososphaerota archaeon]|nr:hypothetical protein [Nitrososphaerota archaeon]
MVNSRRIALGAIFGVLILVTNGFIPAPTSDFLIVVQSLLLALSYLVVGRGGASYVGFVSGALITVPDDAARGSAYEAYVRAAAADPALVGCHWFQWVDEPV